MKSYKKNYAPKCRQDVAGGNDACWIPEAQIWPINKKKFDESIESAFGKKKYWFERNDP